MFSPSQIRIMAKNFINANRSEFPDALLKIISALADQCCTQEGVIKALESGMDKRLKEIGHLDKKIVTLEKRVK